MQKEKNIKNLLGDWHNKKEISEFKGSKNHKFLNRNRTIKSNWPRLHNYARNILLSDTPMKILDVGCGNGATMEIFRYYGHTVQGMDFSPGYIEEGTWIYEPMFKSQNLPCEIHSGSDLPYPFEDNSFDLVICWGAITFFKPIEMWPNIISEFSRLSKNKILLGVNHGDVFQSGKKYLDAWKSNKHRLTLNDNHIYKWDRR